MIIKTKEQAPYLDMSAYNKVSKQVLLGPDDGSSEIVMRYFSIQPGGNTPFHNHPYPHLVKIENGKGIGIDKNGKEIPLEQGQYIYVNDDELHGFKNVGTEPFDFICIVPNRGEK